METKRLFVGTFLEETQIQSLQKMQAAFLPFLTAGRKTSAKKLHFTWAFLGDTPSNQTQLLTDALHNAESLPCFETSFCGVECFNGGTVVALLRQTKPFAEAHKQISAACSVSESRKFRPHVTLFRDAQFELPFAEVKKSVMVFNRPFAISSFSLVESNPQENYAYRPVANFNFAIDC